MPICNIKKNKFAFLIRKDIYKVATNFLKEVFITLL